jgi:2-polyprenyl-6-methoxyphenol hydroxylase-like FAD-dependent oxidoreductase
VRVVVIGAGIGGLATAIALERAGIEPLVVERAPRLEEVGYGLVLSANAVTALRALGLLDGVAARGSRVRRAEVRLPGGETLTSIDYEAAGWDTYGVLRSELQRAMLASVPPERLRLGTTCTGATEDGRVQLDGDELIADAVIGADGIHSVVRRSLFGEEPLRYGGHRAWRAGTRLTEGRALDAFVEVWGRGGGFGFGPAGDDCVYWYCFEAVSVDTPPPAALPEWLLERYGEWFDPIPELIRSTDPRTIHSTFTYDRRPSKTWGRGRVTLMGDVAHPMKPNIGQGAAQAVEDAVVLGTCLAAAARPEDGLRAYERRRVRRAASIVRASRQVGRMAELSSPLAVRMRNVLVKALPDRLALAQQRRILTFRP